jgi:glycosyltransferase involved in cell wall biosynthesis
MFVQFTAEPSGSPMSGLLSVRALRSQGWAVDAVFGKTGSCVALYEAEGCDVQVLPHGSWLSADRWFRQILRWKSEWGAARRFSRFMRDRRPDVVYVNNVTGAAAAVAARWRRIPCVWHLRELFADVGGEFHDPPLGGRAVVRLFLNRLASHIVTVSEAVRINIVGERSIPPVTVVPNAAFTEFFAEHRSPEECRRLLELPSGVPVVGMPGTLRPMKGHAFFLEAASLVNGRHPECHFAITGSGQLAYKTQLENSIARTPLEDRVRFLGTVGDMAAFYRACDVICVPSRSEAAGRAAIEPMAIGTPVIGADVGGLSETLDYGRAGVLVPYGDAVKLNAAITRLLDSPGERARVAAAGRSRAEAEHHEDLYCQRILRIIESVRSPASTG